MARLLHCFTVALLLVALTVSIATVAHSNVLSWDMDHDGNADALTDGLLLLRFSFDLSGDDLTNNAISEGSTLSPSEVEVRINATQAIADIDGNGSVDALTDGLMLLRYLFGLSGDAVTDSAIAPDAVRSTPEAITQYLADNMPGVTTEPEPSDNPVPLSEKRGIGYGTGGGQQELSAQDLQLIDQRLSWFYDWSPSSPASVRGIYTPLGIDFTPMLWGLNSSEYSMRQYLDNNSGVKYLLGFNEPTHLNQANLTPQEAADAWPTLEAIADDYNLQLVSPAVGNSSLYGAWEYLDAFFEACTNCRVDFIAVHKYGNNQEKFKEFIRESYQYGKPIWVTEWAGNGGGGGANWPETPDQHMDFLADTTRWLESEDNVYRYAWFVGRNKQGIENFPHNGLLGENGELTPLGEVYFSIPSKDYLYQSGVKIPAVGATNINGFDHNQITDGDNITALTSSASSNSYLEFDFSIDSPETYILEIRTASPSNGSLTLLQGQETLQTIQNINTGSLSNWQTIITDEFSLNAGITTLRIETSSTLSINSVKLVTPSTATASEPLAGITVNESPFFADTNNELWPKVIPLTLASNGASSQEQQTLSINIIELPAGGATYRVYKTTANGNDYFAESKTLSLGANELSIAAVDFDRTVKIQFSTPDIGFDTLSVNANLLYSYQGQEPDPDSGAEITVGESPIFSDTNNDLWTKVIPLTLQSNGASSQATQTLAINITELPAGGANYRIYKTTANGSESFGNSKVLTLGNNIISVSAVDFDRTAKVQLSSAAIKFNSVAVNGNQLYPNQQNDTETSTAISVGMSSAFAEGPNDTWTNVITLALASDGASSQATKTLSMNITELPSGGAIYRVFKTTANGNVYLSNEKTLVVGSNSITIAAVAFDRTAKVQVSSPNITFDHLSVNGSQVYPSSSGTGISVVDSALFSTGLNDAWPYVVTLSTSSQDSSQSKQILSINITELPAGGANYRVYKTTSSGADYLANPVELSIGPNTISIPAVEFNRTVKVQVSSPDIRYSSLSVATTNDTVAVSEYSLNFEPAEGATVETPYNGYRIPSDAEESAHFENTSTSLYPFDLPYGAEITFKARSNTYVSDPASISFALENDPFPNNTVSYQTEQTAISSSLDFSSYSITLPPIANSIGNIGLLITDRDRIVWLNDVKLTRFETP
jgi:hypothetical protein